MLGGGQDVSRIATAIREPAHKTGPRPCGKGAEKDEPQKPSKQAVKDLPSFLWRLRSARGQSLVEYVLVIALASIAVVAALTAFGGGQGGLYQAIVQDLHL